MIDLDPNPTSVLVEEFVVPEFEIQLEDEGIGLYDASVVSGNVLLILNGAFLRDGTDYVFHYDPSADVIQLSMRADVPDQRNVYQIVLLNNATTGIRDAAANGLLPNQTSGQTRFTITTAGLNDPPIAVDDAYVVREGELLTADDADGSTPGTNDDSVLVNDTDADFDVLAAQLVTPPQFHVGTFVLHPDGTFEYQHDGSDTTADSFTYKAVDAQGAVSDEATAWITITPANDPPTAVDDAYSTDEDTVLNVVVPGVLENDSDVNGDPISVVSADAQSVMGAPVAVNADGSFSYDPTNVALLQDLPAGATISDTFTYTIADDEGLTSAATVTIMVEGINDAPVAAGDGYAITEDQVLAVDPSGVLANDSDRDGDALNIDVANSDSTSALGAMVAFHADGSFTYDPTQASLIRAIAPGEIATDTFTYTVVDSHAATDSAIVTITITGINSAPVATDKSFTTDEDTVLDVAAPGILDGDYDPDGQNIEILDYDTISTLGATVVVHADGSFLYDPRASSQLQALTTGTQLTDTFSYTIVDDDANPRSATATVSVVVTGVNDAPTVANDSVLVPRNTSVIVDVLANDTDVDGTIDPSTVSIQTAPASGSATVLADGTIRYVPDGDFSGNDVLTYTVRDDLGSLSSPATVSIQVDAAPVAENDRVETFQNVPITISVLANDHDDDGTLDPTTVTVVDLPLHGAASITANGRVIYTPDRDFVGNDSFTYTVTDDVGIASNLATVAVAVITDPLPWQNPNNALDVNNDGSVSPIDVLLIISDLNSNGSRELPNPPVAPNTPPPYLDVSGDNKASPIDALSVISYLNAPQGEGEGEPADVRSLSSQSAFQPVCTPLASPAVGSLQNLAASATTDSHTWLSSVESGRGDDFALRIGQSEPTRQVALDSYLSSSALDEALEELANVSQGRHTEELLADQALIELLLGKDANSD